ncbi:MAG: helix-turn-helix domain-containing protein [Actinobacteria bacterium]|nr:helix-turn-helix domain-containing protein [Actinomycetota bacterium]
MIAVVDLVRSLPGLVTLVVPAEGAAIDDVTLAEVDRGGVGVSGDLTLGVGVDDPGSARALVVEAAARRVPAVALRTTVAELPEVAAAARSHGLALLGVAEHVSWAHLVWLLRGLVDRALGVGGPGGGSQAPVGDELFAIADAAAGLVGGPVTIEDVHSRVLAYSSRQEVTDPARVSTIVGRRVPDDVLRHQRARGVFRRLAASPEPFLVTGSPDSPVGTRYVIPVHAGGEWLGSIWAVVGEEPAVSVVAELRRTASVVALHLLQLRSQADLTRRLAMDRLRQVLTGSGPSGVTSSHLDLPPGPWRVVALTSTDPTGEPEDVTRRLDVWEAIFRRRSWPRPRLIDVADVAYALVRDDGEGSPTRKSTPGSWSWMRRVLDAVAADGAALAVGAGGRASTPSELPASLTQAREVAEALRSGATSGPSRTIEEAWVALTLARATTPLRQRLGVTPLAVVARHDDLEGTTHLRTLAAWLDHYGAAGAAAAELAIHPNTLRYRMTRIAELLDAGGVDLSDPRTRLALRLELLALSVPGRP